MRLRRDSGYGCRMRRAEATQEHFLTAETVYCYVLDCISAHEQIELLARSMHLVMVGESFSV